MTETRKKVKILFIEASSGLGGSTRALAEMLRGIDESHFEPMVFFTRPDAVTERLERTGARIIKSTRKPWLSRLRWPVDAFYYWKLMRKLRPEVVHLNNNLYAAVPACFAALALGIPITCHLRSERRPVKSEILLAPFCRRLVAISRTGQRYFRRLMPGAGRRIEMVQDSFVQVESRAVGRARGGGARIGMASNLVRGKGHDTVIAAMPRILAEFPGTRLRIAGCPVGDEPYGRELRAQAEALNVAHAVEFWGWIDDISTFLKGVDLFVDASGLREGYRHTIVEAMQSGLPVIATAVGPVREIIRSESEGVVIPAGDAAAVAAAACALLRDPRRLREMGRNAADAARGRFCSSDSAKKMEHLFLEVAL